MALKIRLQRMGAPHHPEYRVVVADGARACNGKFVENLGHYKVSPRGKDVEMGVDLARVDYWLSVGAKPSDSAKTVLNKARAAVAVAEKKAD